MNKTIIAVLLVIIGLVGLMWWGKSAQKSISPQTEIEIKSSLAAVESFYDFGTISMAKGNVTRIFKVSNPTDKDITLKNVATSCMCTKAYILDGNAKKGPFGMPGMGGLTANRTNVVVKAGETKDIEVVYDPNAHGPAGVGFIDRFIDLTDDTGGTFTFEIQATVTP